MKETTIIRPTGEGVVAPLSAGWAYQVEHIAKDGSLKSVEVARNLMPTEALNYMLNAAFKGGAQYSTLYLGLFDNNVTPSASDTMADVLANYGENQAYTGTERLTISLPVVADGAVDTIASPNEFAFTSSETIRGAFISSSPTWGGGIGLLVSAVLFSSPKIVASGEALRVPCGFALVSA